MDLKDFIRTEAVKHGFDYVGFVKPEQSSFCKEVKEWVLNDMHGDMEWFARNIDKRCDVRKVLDNIQTVIVLGVSYFPPRDFFDPDKQNDPSRGVIARYALIDDYHISIENALNNIIKTVQTKIKKTIACKAYVDTGPILERELAMRAGIGYIGNNTNLITKEHGSYVFLSEILCDIYIEPDEKNDSPRSCKDCERCVRACPTGALEKKHVLNANKCLSYLTIEYKGIIPDEYEKKIGNRIYGCDICQEVCPWNHDKIIKHKETSSIFSFRKDLAYPFLLDCIEMSREDFLNKFRNSPIKRIKYDMFMRNTLGAIGCWGSKEAIQYVIKKLFDESEVIRATTLRTLFRIIQKNPEERKNISQIIKKACKQEDSELVKGFVQSFFG